MKKQILKLIPFCLSAFLFNSCIVSYPIAQQTVESQPAWAPAFENKTVIRYYYFPDYETYYDVNSHEYIYMENGNWYFTSQVPPVYASVNFSDVYVVALNTQVYHPWINHSVYVSHYPRYYYNSYYKTDSRRINNNENIRGFNENDKKPYYEKRGTNQNNSQREDINENRRVTPNAIPTNNVKQNDDQSRRTNNGVTQSSDRNIKNNEVKVNQPDSNNGRRSQPVTYSHPTVGKPVKVDKNTRATQSNTTKTENSSRQNSNSNTNSERRR